MGIIDTVRSWFAPEPKHNDRTLTYEMGTAAGLTLEPTLAGIHINNEKALTVSAYYAAVRHISEAIASLPIRVMQKQPDGGKLALEDHPIAILLNQEPNPYQTKAEFLDWYMTMVILYGNAYAKIEFLNSGRAASVHPLESRFIQAMIRMDSNTQRIQVYHVMASPFTVSEDLAAYETLHIKGITLDGFFGFNPMEMWRESMATSIALERYSASFFGQGCRPTGLLKTAGGLSDKARANLKESWKRAYTGTSNAAGVPVLEEGLEFQAMGEGNNNEYQMIESKQLQVRAMANWAKISPTKIGDLSRATWSNLEQENIQFVISTLTPWVHKLEQEFNRKLLLPSEKAQLTVEFDLSGLLRGDSRTRYANYQSALSAGWLTPNEVRGMEGLPPVENGDVLRTPVNLAPIDGSDKEEPAKKEEEIDTELEKVSD
jgi:HK97 family phage portal protein